VRPGRWGKRDGGTGKEKRRDRKFRDTGTLYPISDFTTVRPAL